MKVPFLSLMLALALPLLMNKEVSAEAAEILKSRMIADFEDERELSHVVASDGVKISLTDKDVVTGKRCLEARVARFSEHKNHWPYVCLGPAFLTTPIDVSTYSRLSISIRNVTEGLRNVNIGWSTLPYNDGGRNFEGDLFLIPGGTSWDCSVLTGAFENNDPSSIALLYIVFPVAEADGVYRIDAIRAVYDPALGSPAEKLKCQAGKLQGQLDAWKGKITGLNIRQDRQAAWQQKLADLDVPVRQVAATAAQAGTPAFAGKFKATREKIGDLSARMGEFLFADKKDFVAWQISPYVNIIKSELPDVSSQIVEKIDVRMAGNEFRDTLFMLSPCDKDLKLVVKIETGDGLPTRAVEVFETRYLKTRNGQETGEPLYPLEGPLTIPNHQSRQITLRFNTRTHAVRPGTYTFKIILRDVDAQIEKVILGTLVVWDFALPDYDILSSNGYAELDSSEFSQGNLSALAVADMKTFGMNIISIHPVEMPKIIELDAEGNVTKIDAKAFESRLGRIVNAWRAAPGREKLQLLFAISSTYNLGVKGLDQPFPNARWQKALAQWLKALSTTLHKYDLSYADWFIALGDEASEVALINSEIPAAEGLKAADPRVRTINNTSTALSDPAMTQRFYKAFDILQPHLPAFKSQPALREWIEKAGKPVWTYKCLGNWSDKGKNVYEYYRVYGWDLVKYGLTGTGIWTYCAQAVNNQGCGYLMIYKHAQRDQVVHSRRFEFIREGMDDYRYLWKLKELARTKGPQAVTTTSNLIQNAVADITADVTDTGRCEKWRLVIAQEILRLSKTP
jgi:hypothetical protein